MHSIFAGLRFVSCPVSPHHVLVHRETIPLHGDTMSSYFITLPSFPLNFLHCDHLTTHLPISSSIIAVISFLFPHNGHQSVLPFQMYLDIAFLLSYISSELKYFCFIDFFFPKKKYASLAPEHKFPTAITLQCLLLLSAFAAQLAEHASVYFIFLQKQNLRFYSRSVLTQEKKGKKNTCLEALYRKKKKEREFNFFFFPPPRY